MPKKEFTGGSDDFEMIRILDGHKAPARTTSTTRSDEAVISDARARANAHEAETGMHMEG